MRLLAEASCEQVMDVLGDVAAAAVADPDERGKLAYLLARWGRLAASGVVPDWSICASLRSGAQSPPGGSGLSGSPNPLVVILVIAAA